MPLAEVIFARPRMRSLSDLAAQDVLLAECDACQWLSHHSPWQLHLSFPPRTALDHIASTLRCPNCNSRGARSLKVLRAHYDGAD